VTGRDASVQPIRRRAGTTALTHAYAVSVHKAQGAEFPAVVIPLVPGHAPMLGRTLLHTALTRAWRLVVIVGRSGTPRWAACWTARCDSLGEPEVEAAKLPTRALSSRMA